SEGLVFAEQLSLELADSLLLPSPLSATAEGRKRLLAPLADRRLVQPLSTKVRTELTAAQATRLVEHPQALLGEPILWPAPRSRRRFVLRIVRHGGHVNRFLQPPRECRLRHTARFRQRPRRRTSWREQLLDHVPFELVRIPTHRVLSCVAPELLSTVGAGLCARRRRQLTLTQGAFGGSGSSGRSSGARCCRMRSAQRLASMRTRSRGAAALCRSPIRGSALRSYRTSPRASR